MMHETFIGRENELSDLNELYSQDKFQLFVLYGRRRVGKTTLLNQFCKDKEAIFYSAEQSNNKLNLEKFSLRVFSFYGENNLEPFSSWANALSYIDERQNGKKLVLVIDEFPYLVKKNKSLLSELQHLIDHKLTKGNLFMILCGSYMGFMEKEVLGSKSPLFGRRTAQLHMKPFNYQTSSIFLDGRNGKLDLSVLRELKTKADIYSKNRRCTYYALFSKAGFTDAVINEANSDDSIMLVELSDLMNF